MPFDCAKSAPLRERQHTFTRLPSYFVKALLNNTRRILIQDDWGLVLASFFTHCSIYRSSEILPSDRSNPLLEDGSITIDKKDMRLVTVSQVYFKGISGWIVYIQVDEINSVKIFRFKPMHDGRYRSTGRSPECKKFDQLRSSGS